MELGPPLAVVVDVDAVVVVLAGDGPGLLRLEVLEVLDEYLVLLIVENAFLLFDAGEVDLLEDVQGGAFEVRGGEFEELDGLGLVARGSLKLDFGVALAFFV